MKLPVIAAVIVATVTTAHAEICYPGGNAELRDCLEDGTWRRSSPPASGSSIPPRARSS